MPFIPLTCATLNAAASIGQAATFAARRHHIFGTHPGRTAPATASQRHVITQAASNFPFASDDDSKREFALVSI